LTTSDPTCVPDRTNLVWRAADEVWRASGRRGAARDVEMHLVKRIPMQAGLGGGSSDAAAAVRALASIWKVDDRRLRPIAARLGADVPYFFEGGTALGLERGDLVYPLAERERAWVTLVLPPFGVSTKDAFGWWDAGRSGADVRGGSTAEDGNDLQDPVAAHHPEIRRLVRALGRCGASTAAMSGSGSVVFGLFSTRAAADQAARALEGHGRTWTTRTLTRAAYQRLVAVQPIV
jgi:4-diphosphocytidyl-2-C-methyl-D-erythritol kinase